MNTVLSSIGDNSKTTPSTPSSSIAGVIGITQKSRDAPISSDAAHSAVTAGAKRKADFSLDGAPAKEPRREVPSATTQTRKLETAVPGSSTSTVPGSLPYRGTAKHATAAASRTPQSRTSQDQLAGAPDKRAAAPKPGSYKDMLARAKAQQAAGPSIGVIKHKPVDRHTRKEKRAEALAKSRHPLGKVKDGTRGQDTRNKSAEPDPRTVAVRSTKPKRQPVELEYKGTMRPSGVAVPAYRSAIAQPVLSRRPKREDSRPGISRTQSLPPSKPKYRTIGYAGHVGAGGGKNEEEEDEEVEEEQEEEDSYESEASSNMEATGFEMEQEEQAALRAAKQEDEKELRLENELKRQKAERRKKLEQLAAKAGTKKRF